MKNRTSELTGQIILSSYFGITPEEIDGALQRGSGFEGGKKRIIDFFKKEPGLTARADFLKHEYGTGGWNYALKNYEGYSFLDHDPHGITITKAIGGERETVKLTYSEAAERIDRMIKEGVYA